MWMTAVFSVFGQVLTRSAFLVLFQPNGCAEALPQVKVRSRHCHHPLLTGAYLAASLELPLSWSPDRPPTHSPLSCWALVVSGPWVSRTLWLSLQFKDLRDHLNCPHSMLSHLSGYLGENCLSFWTNWMGAGQDRDLASFRLTIFKFSSKLIRGCRDRMGENCF